MLKWKVGSFHFINSAFLQCRILSWIQINLFFFTVLSFYGHRVYLAALGIRSFAWAHPLPLRYLLEHQSQQYLGTKCHLANGLWLPDTVTASRHTPAHQSCHLGDAECLNHGTHGTSTCTFCTGEGDLCQASSSFCLRASQGKATSSQSTNKLPKQVFFPVLSLNVLNGARVALSFPPWRRAGVASTPSRDKAPGSAASLFHSAPRSAPRRAQDHSCSPKPAWFIQ